MIRHLLLLLGVFNYIQALPTDWENKLKDELDQVTKPDSQVFAQFKPPSKFNLEEEKFKALPEQPIKNNDLDIYFQEETAFSSLKSKK